MKTASHFSATRRVRAFTLVELLAVIGVVSVIMVLTAVYSTGSLEGRRMGSAINEITNLGMLARLEAVKRRSVVHLAFGPRSPIDDGSFSAVAVIAERRDPQTGETSLEYVTKWHRLPDIIFIDYDGVDTDMDSVFESEEIRDVPYLGNGTRDLPVITYLPDGALNPAEPGQRRIVLRVGMRSATDALPQWREAADALTSTVEIEPFTGRATVVRDEHVER